MKYLKLATLIFLVLVQLDIILTSKKKIMEEEKEPLRESLFVFMWFQSRLTKKKLSKKPQRSFIFEYNFVLFFMRNIL